jgi:hypothetical protein
MASLLVGVGLLVLAVRFSMVWYSTNPKRTGPSPAIFGLIVWGVVWFLIGFAMIMVDGIFRGWSSDEFAKAWAPSGGAIMLLGGSWILQGCVNLSKGHIRLLVICAAFSVAVVGIILILVQYLN